jgi:hypothetical protein
VHPVRDVRVFQKECLSLVAAGYSVTLVAPHDRDEMIEGVRVCGVGVAGGRLARMTASVLRVLRRAREVDADIYQFHDSELLPAGRLLAALGRHVIYDVHEDVPRDLLTRHYLPPSIRRAVAWAVERVENSSARRFSAIVAATPAIGDRFRPLNPRTAVINNYPILAELAPPADRCWSSREPAVAYIGAIAEERGIVEMVQAMAVLPPGLEATLHLAGSFSPPGDRALVERLAGWARVRELGQLSRPDVAALLGRVRAGLALFRPAPNHVSAQPNKLFEYMAAGIPLVASDFPLWRDLVDGAGCGLLVDPFDPTAVARAIEYLFTHSAEAEAMGRRGREAVQARYHWESQAAALLRLYDEILAEVPSPGDGPPASSAGGGVAAPGRGGRPS